MNRVLSLLAALFSVGALASTVGAARQDEVALITQGAPIILLKDIDSGQVLFQREADRRFIPASITKIMSAYVAFEMIEGGKLSLDQSFAMSETAAEEWYRTGSTMFLEPGEAVPLDTLLRGITSVSANDASIVLAEGASGSVANWVSQMNAAARDLGMKDSHFGTPNGWPDDGKTFTTANDLAILSRAMIERHPTEYGRYFGKEGLRHNGFAQANHDPISGVIEGADGIKTGYTNQAGNGFVGSAERGGTRLLMVVAAVDGVDTRNQISRDLIEWGFDAFDRNAIFQKRAKVGTARVQNGEHSEVTLVARGDINIAIPADTTASPTFAIKYEGPLEAPVKAGEPVANLVMKLDGRTAARIPLLAAEDVKRAGLLRRIANAFAGWFG